MNRLKVVICGKEYALQTKEDATYVYNLDSSLSKCFKSSNRDSATITDAL